MNAVFERFIRVAVREALRLNVQAFPEAARGRPVHLDIEPRGPRSNRISPGGPEAAACSSATASTRETEGTIPNADVYQMLAYLTALQLEDGLLVYAAGEDVPHTITVPFADKRDSGTDHRRCPSTQRCTYADCETRWPDPIHSEYARYDNGCCLAVRPWLTTRTC